MMSRGEYYLTIQHWKNRDDLQNYLNFLDPYVPNYHPGACCLTTPDEDLQADYH